MTEKQYEKALQALGAENVTTERQRNNGTTAFKLPTGQVVSEHETTNKARMRIWSRKARLKKLFLYTIKKLNYEL